MRGDRQTQCLVERGLRRPDEVRIVREARVGKQTQSLGTVEVRQSAAGLFFVSLALPRHDRTRNKWLRALGKAHGTGEKSQH